MKNLISINLLPRELLEENKRTVQRPWLSRVSIGLIIVSIIATVGVFGLGISQAAGLNNSLQDVSELESKISSLKDKEGLLTVLKTRLDKINTLSSDETIQTKAYLITTSLMPSDVKLTNLSISKGNKVALTGDTNSVTSLETFFNNLVNSPDKVSSVKLESLSRTVRGDIRFDLNFALNGKGVASD